MSKRSRYKRQEVGSEPSPGWERKGQRGKDTLPLGFGWGGMRIWSSRTPTPSMAGCCAGLVGASWAMPCLTDVNKEELVPVVRRACAITDEFVLESQQWSWPSCKSVGVGAVCMVFTFCLAHGWGISTCLVFSQPMQNEREMSLIDRSLPGEVISSQISVAVLMFQTKLFMFEVFWVPFLLASR